MLFGGVAVSTLQEIASAIKLPRKDVMRNCEELNYTVLTHFYNSCPNALR